MPDAAWTSLGNIEDLRGRALRLVEVEGRKITLSWKDGRFGAISGSCLHAGGPLGEGTLKEDYVVCPWHHWMFHRETGEARPGIPAAVPRHDLKEEHGQLWVNLVPSTAAKRPGYPPHPLTRPLDRTPGPVRVLGLSCTAMNAAFPRFSTSEALLAEALAEASARGAETKLIRLNDLKFRACEGYYSKSASACTWPCTITQQDPSDELVQVYEALVFWADAVLVATPIRWGNAGSLYYRMAERLNTVQNQVTLADRVLIRNKAAAFIVTGGQDNVQGVVGQMLTFFGELGFSFPQFPFIAHSRGWDAEDMERNVVEVQESASLKEGARSLAARAVDLAARLVGSEWNASAVSTGGRKAHPLT